MKNLKRILSLALAGTMLVGMMVVGASAADFTDADKIEHTEAVETLTALKIIEGNPQTDGTLEFNPQGGLRRAEMAVMLAKILNKGTVPTWAVKEKPTFDDVAKGYWGEAAIEYCYNLGVVNGYSATAFGPNDELTATQAARMILNAMGYKIEGGSDWALQTEIQARDENLDLYNGLDEVVTNEAISRDNVAQMLYTALNAPLANAEVTQSTVYALSSDGTEANILKAHGYFDSVSDAKAFADVNSITGVKIVRTTLTKTEKLGEKYLGLQTQDITVATVKYDKTNQVYKVNNIYTVAEDVSNLLGHSVTVLYKGSGATMKTYGFVDGSAVLGEGNVGDLGASVAATAKKIKLGGVELDLAGTADAIEVYDLNSTNTPAKLNAFTTTGKEYNKIVAITDNGKTVARLVTIPVQYGKVGYVGSTQFTVTGVDTFTTKDVDVYEGLKKDDKVLVTAAANTVDGKAKIEKAPVTEGVTANAIKGTNQVRVDGAWYTANTAAYDILKNLGTFNVVILNGYIVDAAAPTGTSGAAAGVADVFMVTAVGDFSAASTFKGTPALYPVRIITATGEVTELNVAEIYNATSQEFDKVTKADNDSVAPAQNTLYTATKDDNGNYKLTAVATTGTWGDLSVVEQGTDKIKEGETTISGTKYRFDNDAVVFVYSTGKFGAAVLKGSDVKIWAETTPTAGGLIYTADKNGFPYVSMALVNLGSDNTLPGETPDKGLGWIVSAAVYTKDGDTAALEIEIWDGETTRTVLATSLDSGTLDAAAAASYGKGVFITFDEGDNNKITKLAALDALAPDAIIAWDGNNIFKLKTGASSAEQELDKWTTLYVNTKDGKGVEGGDIRVADKSDLGDYVENVYADAASKILVVDVNNLLAKLKTAVTFPTEAGEVIKSVNDGKTEITIITGKTAEDVETAAKALAGAKNANVIDATGEDVADSTAVADGNILQITTESGRLYSLTIKVEAATPTEGD